MTHPYREELAGRPANDEAGLFYRLEDDGAKITLRVDHQGFAIGPEFDDTPTGKHEREWFRCMIHVAMRRVIERAVAAAALRQSPTVEEVARVIAPDAFDRAVPIGPRRVIHRNAMKAAHAIDRLYRGSKE